MLIFCDKWHKYIVIRFEKIIELLLFANAIVWLWLCTQFWLRSKWTELVGRWVGRKQCNIRFHLVHLLFQSQCCLLFCPLLKNKNTIGEWAYWFILRLTGLRQRMRFEAKKNSNLFHELQMNSLAKIIKDANKEHESEKDFPLMKTKVRNHEYRVLNINRNNTIQAKTIRTIEKVKV